MSGVEWCGWGGGGDKGSCGGQIGGVLQLSGGSWGGDEVGVAGEWRWLACKDGMAMLHCHPIMVQGEWKDKKEREKLIEVGCEACVGRCSKGAMVLVGGQAGVACVHKRTVMSWPPLSCNSLK